MKRLLLFAALLFAACTDANIDEAANVSDIGEKIYATIDNIEDDTRVELNDKLQTVWTEGDEILTFCNDHIKRWSFDGKTGDRSGSFTLTKTHDGPSTDKVVYDKYYALHLSANSYSWFSDKSPAFLTSVPSTQYFKDHSYGLKTNAMIGTSTDGKKYSFKNIFGYLRLSITGSEVVKSIQISGNNEEIISGDIYIDQHGTCIQWGDTTSTTTILDCGNGVQLSKTPVDFYITLPPISFEKGINIVVNLKSGEQYPKRTSKVVHIKRNTILPMGQFNIDNDFEWQTISISHSGRRIATPTLFGGSSLVGYIYWGDGYYENINTSSSYVYDDEESHTITIKSMNAESFTINNCSGISEIDLSNF